MNATWPARMRFGVSRGSVSNFRIFPMLLIFLMGIICVGSLPASAKGPDYGEESKTFLRLMTEGKFDDAYARMSDDVMKQISKDNLAKIWKTLSEQAGSFQDFGTPSVSVTGNLHNVDVPMRFQNVEITWRVAWDETGAVAKFFSAGAKQVSGSAAAKTAGADDKPAASATPGDGPKAGSVARPSYIDANRFREEEITLGVDPWKLPGTLALPVVPEGKAKPFPSVILVHGSGPGDRDETIGPNKPFRNLAQGLASRGVAVLRYDKRTRVYGPQMDVKQITVEEEVLADVSFAIDFLKTRPDCDPKRIVVLGHSLGGQLAPLVAKKHPELAGIVIFAGAARPLLSMMVEQLTYVRSLSTDSTEIKALDDMMKMTKDAMDPSLPDTAAVLGGMASERYFRDLESRNVLAVAAKLKLPILVMQGGRDYQVTKEDFQLWKKVLSGNLRATFREYPDLNHLFSKGVGKSTPAEYAEAGGIAPEVIGELASWVMAR